jgi:hypothetical protein
MMSWRWCRVEGLVFGYWMRRLRHRFARIQGSSAEADKIKEEEIRRRKTSLEVGFSNPSVS